MPSLAGFFLLPLLGGFFFLYFLNRTRFYYRKLDGHRLFFLAAVCGIFFFTTSRIIILLLDQTVLGPALRRPLKSFADFSFSGASIGALLLGLALPWIGNLRRRKQGDATRAKKAVEKLMNTWRDIGSFWDKHWPFEANRYQTLLQVAHDEDNLLDLLLRAQRDTAPVLLILDNGKAYVGYVLHAPPNLELPYVKLFPTISGYRTKEQLDLELTTIYEKSLTLLDKSQQGKLTEAEEEQMERLQIILKRDKILSASFFDRELYRSHQEARKKKPQKRNPDDSPALKPARNAG